MDYEESQYPIGRFQYGQSYSAQQIEELISKLRNLPAALKNCLARFTPKQLELTYRRHGWTAKQLINHLVDVYIHGYVRTKWLLTEDQTVLKPYDQDSCARLPDSKFANWESSLILIDQIIQRWSFLIEGVMPYDSSKRIYHPEYRRWHSLQELLAMYTWHGYHHLAHLELIRQKGIPAD